jgi:hypothetical protein
MGNRSLAHCASMTGESPGGNVHARAWQLAIVVAVAMGSATRAAQPDARQMGGIGITVFEDSNYRGRNATFRDDEPDLRRAGLNDRIQSLQVAPGEMWEVCRDIQYRDCVQVSSDYSDLRRLGNLSGEISSARPWRSGGGFPGPGPGPVPPFPGPGVRGRLVIYSGINFTGRATVVSTQSSAINLRSAGSVRVEGGNWQICEDTNFRGRCSTVNVDVPDIRSFGLPGRVRSARPNAPPQYDE